MRILAIGDFHGKVPTILKRFVKINNIDLIVGTGDYTPFSLRKEFFKYGYSGDFELWRAIGKKKVKEGTLKDLKQEEAVIKKLNGLSVKTISITGNTDYTKWGDAYDSKKPEWRWPIQDFFSKFVKKYNNIKVIDYSFARFGDFVFIGIANSTFPGIVKSKNYRIYRKKLDKLFKRFEKEKVILVSHNMPYGKLDKIESVDFDKRLKREHYGSKLARRLIERYHPILFIGGHMHENQGKVKIGKTIVVNPGYGREGEAAVITMPEKRVKFVKI
ncbi:MAG: metallophosphoesterase [Candidatus Aenigmatarchaeota archaeon]